MRIHNVMYHEPRRRGISFFLSFLLSVDSIGRIRVEKRVAHVAAGVSSPSPYLNGPLPCLTPYNGK